MDLGIDDKRIQVEGYGDEYPVDANASERVGRRTVGWKLCSPTKKASWAPPARVASLETRPVVSAGFFRLPNGAQTVQFLLTLHCTVDYCGNCPRTLLNCSGIVSHKNKMPVKSSAAS
jgi:hypothetical protein